MNHHAFTTKAVAGILATATLGLSGASARADDELPAYEKTSGVSGTLNAIGSDTLNNLMALWSEGFKAVYPNVNFQIEGKGSSTAPPALIEGTAQLGPMSRAMKKEEIDLFEKKFGYKPTEIKVAIDALAVFVHKDNPLEGLTLKQVDGMFSSTLKLGGKAIENWGDAGLEGEWASRPISLYGRNSASGTYGYFQEVALGKGDYKATVKEQPGSSAVVQGIASDKFGIGYSGIGYKTSGVKIVPLGTEDGKYFDGTAENALSGDYPLARFLYIYVNKKPVKPSIILMDEPCSALDPIATIRIEELITRLKEQFTIVIVTHNMQQATRCSDRTAFFYLGELVEHGLTTDIFSNPKHTKTEEYVSGRFG